MNGRVGAVVLVGLLGLTLAGFAVLLRLRLDRGDSFPMYSSLRSDPFGLRALHDSLERLPELTVTRSFERLEDLASMPARTIVLAGVWHSNLHAMPGEEARAIEAALREGCRVVIATHDVHDLSDVDEVWMDAEDDEREKPKNVAKEKEEEKTTTDLAGRWKVRTNVRWLVRDALPAEQALEGFREMPRWTSDVYFSFPSEVSWKVLYRRGGEPVLIERAVGRGSVVLAGSGFFLTNEALQRERVPELLAWVVGPHRRVEFHEGHLGVVEQRGVVALAKSYGLSGACFVLAVAAALFVWHRMALFVPPAPEAREVAMTYRPTAGLEALLRRAVAPRELAAACLAEARRWLRPADVERAEAALKKAEAGDASPGETYNAIARALRRRETKEIS